MSTHGIATLFDSGYIPDAKAGQNMTLVFRNPISNITVYPDDSVESNCFSMNFDSFLADVKVEETNQIDYSADGSVKVCESAGACSVTLVFDERSSNYPWLVTNVEGDDIGDIIVTGNDNGVTIAADNLNDITVTVSDFEIEKQIAFSTEESSVQIVDSKTGSPMVMIDKNRDGIYESELYEKGDSSNSAAPTYAPVIEQNVGGTISVNNKHPVKGECVSITPAPDAGACSFTDVPAGQYYTDAVAWANENAIVKGYSAENFGPNDPITREQMASILHRYAAFKGYDITTTSDLAAFTDANTVSDWALDSVKRANAEKLTNGRTATTLVPKGNATRAEVAQILMTFSQNVAKQNSQVP